MNNKTLSPDKMISRARIKLLLNQAFLGTLALNMKVKDGESIGCQTMATDGRTLFYNAGFVSGLTDLQLQGVIAHELCHVITQHVLEWRRPNTKEFPELFTMAQEYVVNDMVVNMFKWTDKNHHTYSLELPGNVLIDKDFFGMYTEQVYHELLKRYKPQKISMKDLMKMLEDGMVDQHGLTDGQGGDKDGKDSPGQGQGEAQGMPYASKAELDALAKEIRAKVAQAANAARMAGKLPAGLERIIDDALEPKVNWRAALAEFLSGMAKDDYSWKVPNRRHMYRGVILPSMRSESIDLALMFDTSGSISKEDLTEAWSEAKAIMRSFGSYTLHLIGCDADVHSYQAVGPWDEPDLKELFKGGGGTNFSPPFEKLKEEEVNPRAAVYFTADACGTFPDDPGFPVLWIVKNGAMEVPFGRTIILES